MHRTQNHSAASRVPSYEFRLLLNTRRTQLLGVGPKNIADLLAIDGALARISAGRFGLCMACGGEIDRARLKSAPTSAVCQPCEAAAGQ